MTARTRLIGWTVGCLVVLAACSGGGGVASPAAGGGASVDASEAPSTAASAAASEAASAAASPASGQAAGATGACALLTAEEVSSALGVTVEVEGGDPTSCFYIVPETGAVAAATQLATDGAVSTFDSLKMDPEATAVAGIGDGAVWRPAYAATQLHILKGESLLSIAVGTLSGVPIDAFPSDITPDQLLAMTTALGKVAVDRM